MKNELGVIGRGIQYSLSPEIHKHFAEQFKMNINSEIYDIKDNPSSFVKNFFDEGGLGLNITKPYKEEIAQKVFNTDEAVNCIYEKGKKATSTDGSGFLNDLLSKNIDIANKKILIYGLGGAGKSIANSMQGAEKLFIAGRNNEKSKELINQSDKYLEYDGSELDMLVSCTTQLDLNTIKDFEHFNLTKEAILYDINYSNQTNVIFSELQLVKENNLINGIGMLVEQAAKSFSLWFGEMPETYTIKGILNERL